MRVDILESIKFFDDPAEVGHASAVIGVVGEDLCASSFAHYINSRNNSSNCVVLDLPVSKGTLRGHRLDRWIVDNDNRIIYQSEIKNWSSTAKNGVRLPVLAKDDLVRRVVELNLNNQIKGSFYQADKVLEKMSKPEIYTQYTLRPLLIYWMPISTDGVTPFSKIKVEDMNLAYTPSEFSELELFSVSLYFRKLLQEVESLDLDMPNAEKRLVVLGNLLKSS